MYTITDLSINEPDKYDDDGTKVKTICVTVRCDGYDSDSIKRDYGAFPSGETGSTTVCLTVDYSNDARIVAARIKAELAKRIVDRTEEKQLLGELMQLGPTAINK